MPVRRRGEDTKEKILQEACWVFAEKGYRDATHAEICSRADVNVAAINYYFASKENLYRAVFEHLLDQAELLYPFQGGLPDSALAKDRLGAFIRSSISRMFDPERLGNLHRIMMSEMLEPSGLLTEHMDKSLARNRERLLGILRELAGPEIPQRDLEWCELSVVGQCFLPSHGPGGEKKGPRAIFRLDASMIDALTEHILTFSLAGIEAIRRRSHKKRARATGERIEDLP